MISKQSANAPYACFAAEGFDAMRLAAYRDGALDAKMRGLIAVAFAIAINAGRAQTQSLEAMKALQAFSQGSG